MQPLHSSHPGYIFLLSVLAVGIIALATTVSLLLLGWSAEQSGFVVHQSAQAWENAQTCVEGAIRRLRQDLSYVGSGAFAQGRGDCRILALGGAGNEHRTICSIGTVATSTRRIEVVLERVLPSAIVTSWREVASFSLCP